MDPLTPRELAAELGHVETRPGARVRAYLRERHPDHVHSARWELTDEQADDVRAHFRDGR